MIIQEQKASPTWTKANSHGNHGQRQHAKKGYLRESEYACLFVILNDIKFWVTQQQGNLNAVCAVLAQVIWGSFIILFYYLFFYSIVLFYFYERLKFHVLGFCNVYYNRRVVM